VLIGNFWLLFGLLAAEPHQQWFVTVLAVAFGGPGLVILERNYLDPDRRQWPMDHGSAQTDGQCCVLIGNVWLLVALLATELHQQYFAVGLAVAFGGPGVAILENCRRMGQRPPPDYGSAQEAEDSSRFRALDS
jgi:hypothetical protein